MKTNISLNTNSREYVGNGESQHIFSILRKMEKELPTKYLIDVVELKQYIEKLIISNVELAVDYIAGEDAHICTGKLPF